MASGSQDKSIKVWDLIERKELYSLNGHTDIVWCLAVLKNNQLASGSRDKSIKIWDLKERKELFSLHGHTYNVFCLALIIKLNKEHRID